MYLSDASITPRARLADADDKRAANAKARAETALRASGLTYTIIRTHGCNDAAAGARDVCLDQAGALAAGGATVSRAALAELVVASLLEPRARNVALYASDRRLAPADALAAHDAAAAGADDGAPAAASLFDFGLSLIHISEPTRPY